MKAGRLNSRLTILQPIFIVNDFGERRTTYANAGYCDAERASMSGSRSEEVDEHFPDYRANWVTSIAVTVDENWRLQDTETGYLYTVTNVVLNRRRGMKTLICTRVNE